MAGHSPEQAEWDRMASMITDAEFRVLPLLATHLSFAQIGKRIHISGHTAKSHAISIYRKLGVRSRSEAVERAIEIGLLEQWEVQLRRDAKPRDVRGSSGMA